MANLVKGSDGQFWTVSPEGELHSTDINDASEKVRSGFTPATPQQVTDAEKELALRQEFKGAAGGAKAAGFAAVREGIPLIGDDILELAGVSEERQAAGIAERPLLSGAGGVGGFVLGAIATGAAATAVGGAARAGQAGGVVARLAQAAQGSRGARAAYSLGTGAIAGGAAAAGASESARIASGVSEQDRDIKRLQDDVVAGSVFGGALSMVALLGRGVAGGAARRAGLSKAAGAGDDFASVMSKELKSIKDPMLRSEARQGHLAYRKSLQGVADDELVAMAEKATPDAALTRTQIPSQMSTGLEKAAVLAELSTRKASSQVANAVAMVGAGAAAGAVHPMLGLAVVAGRGAGGIMGGAARGGAITGAKNVLNGAIEQVARGAVTPMVRLGIAKTTRQVASAVATVAGVSAVSVGAARVIDTDNYSSVRQAIESAPDPEMRAAALIDAGLEPEVAAQVVSQQTSMLVTLDKALPRTAKPSEPTLARANRYLDAIMRPDNVLKRMKNLSLTAEDVEVMKEQDHEGLEWVQQIIEQARDEDDADFTPAQRAQQDLILGYEIGISGAALQANFEKQRNMKPRQGHVLNIAKHHKTNMQSLEA